MNAVQVCIIDEVSRAQRVADLLDQSSRPYVVTIAQAMTPELATRFFGREFHVCFVPQVTLLAHQALRSAATIVIAEDDERTLVAALAAGAATCIAHDELTPYVLDLAIRYALKTRQQIVRLQGAYRKLQNDYQQLDDQVDSLRDRLSQYEEVTGRITLPPDWPPNQ